MNNTVIGECYFRVSKHLGITISKVIKYKFHPDIKLLLNKYYNIVMSEQREYEKVKKMEKNMPKM